jgi:heat shock protein HtpX
MTLYTQNSRNRLKTWFFLALYIGLILLVGRVFAWYMGSNLFFVAAAVIAVVQGGASYWFSDKIALAASAATPLDPKKYDRVYVVMDRLCVTAGLPMPKMYLIPDTAMNAFATGRDAAHASVAVTSGLVERLNERELEGVLAHELSHIGNEDIRLMSMVMVMAGLIALVSDWLMHSFWFGGGNRDEREGSSSSFAPFIAIGLAILAPIAATLIQLAISRRREFLADANAVLLTRYPEGMISALRKISGDHEPLEVANKATAHMYFSNPLKDGGLAALFSTHPPVAQRIKALEQGTGMAQ